MADYNSDYTGAEVEALLDKIDSMPNITVSSAEPTASDGTNGDIWIVVP